MSFLAVRNSSSITNATMTTVSNNGIDVVTSSSPSSSSSLSSSSATTTITNVNVSGTCTFSTATTTTNAGSPASCLSSAQQEEYLQQQQQYQQFQQQQHQINHQKYNYYHPPPAVGNSLHFSINNNVGDVSTSANSAATTCTNSLATISTVMATTTTAATITSTTTATSTGLATLNGNFNLENGAAIINGNNNNNNNDNSRNFNSNYSNGNSSNSITTTNATTCSSNSSKINPTPPSVAGNFIIGHKTDVAASSSGIVGINSTSAFKKQPQLHVSPEDVITLGGSSSVNSQILTNNNNHLGTNNAITTTTTTTTIVNGAGNSCSNNHNLSSILKGSKENLLQNNYCNGSVGGSTSGSEGIGSGPLNIPDHDDPGDGLGPLPPKWETAYTERGELYFIDHNTGTSHWLDPRLSKYQKKSLEECGEDELPYGWEKIEDSLYGTYYIDHVNRKTQYENPVLEAKRRAAEQKQQQQQQQQQQHLQSHQQHQHQLPPQRPQTPSSSSGLNGTNATMPLGSVSSASTLSTVDISQRAMQPTPAMAQEQNANKPPLLPYKFTRNPSEMQGQRITTTLLKSARGLGITIVGGDDGVEEFLQIKSIVPNGPAWLDGQLQMGDVLVYVNETCVLGFTHHEMVNVFQSIMPGESVTLEVCRGYPLPFDPNDPNTEVVTTIAVDGISAHEPDKQRRMLMDLNMDGNYNFLDISGTNSNDGNNLNHNLSSSSAIDNSGFILMKKPEVHVFSIVKGTIGFGFTIADSSYGQKVKKILDRACCHQLQEGDILLEINDIVVRNKSHVDVVQILKDCSKTEPTLLKIQRPVTTTTAANDSSPNSAVQAAGGNNTVAKLRKNFLGATTGGLGNNALFRSKTPTADLYSTMQKEILPIRPKTPLVDTRRARVNTPNIELNEDREVAAVNTSAEQTALERSLAESKSHLNEGNKSQNSLSEIDAINNDIPFMDPYPKMVTSLSERLAGVTMPSDVSLNNGAVGPTVGGYLRTTASGVPNYENHGDYVSASSGNFSSIYGLAQMPPVMSPLSGGLYGPPATSSPTAGGLIPPAPGSYHHHHESCFCYECQDFRNNRLRNTTAMHNLQPPAHQQQQPSPRSYYPVYHPPQHGHSQYSPASSASLQAVHIQNERMQKRVNELLNDRRRAGFSPLDHQHHNQMQINNGIGGSTVGGGVGSYSPSQQQYLYRQSSHGTMNHQQQHSPAQQQVPKWPNNGGVINYNTLQPTVGLMRNGFHESGDILDGSGEQFVLSEVTLQRQALGFGFRIVGGTEEGSQVTVGHIVPGGAADNDHRITTGDEILSIDGINVVNSSHHKVVSLMGEAALRGQVTMILRRRMRPAMPHPQMQQHTLQQPQLVVQQSILNNTPISASGGMLQHSAPLQSLLRNNPVRYPYDVIVTRHENEGFGFVIISSSNQYYGSTIGKLIPGSPADRCGELKVGDRIIAVNRIDIAGMSHGDVVNLIKESGLHVRLTIGCPKEGAIINAAPTMPAGSGVNATSGSGGLLLNSAQASPGQVSQTLTPTLQTNLDQLTPYFERPLLSGGSNAGSATSSTSHHQQPAQQSPNSLSVPPQL